MIIEILLWAILPAILISIYIAKKDLFPEPNKAIASAIALGFLIFIPHEIFFIFFGEYYWSIYYDSLTDRHFINLLESFFQAAFLEESLKFLVFLFFVSKFNAFNEPMDAIVYGVCISLGFSLMETLEWTYIAYSNEGPDQALLEAQSRAWSSNTMHAGFGILMGTFLSNAFFQKKNNFIKLVLALFIPTSFHGFYNFSIGYGANTLSTILILLSIGIILFGWRKARERQKLKKMELEDKVISINFFHISSTVLINFALVLLIIYLMK